MALLIVAQHLMERLQEGMARPEQPKADARASEPKAKTSCTGQVFQFKITLKGIEPPIWRRIQTRDCTLDKLHDISRRRWAGRTRICTSSRSAALFTAIPSCFMRAGKTKSRQSTRSAPN